MMVQYKKPLGWPRYMVERKLASGAIAYYWVVPTKFRKQSCPLANEALGTDYAEAKARCDQILNPQLDAWRLGDTEPRGPAKGTLSWLIMKYRESRKFSEISERTRRDYLQAFDLISQLKPLKLPKYKIMGDIPLNLISFAVADRLYERISQKPDGSTRTTTANKAMRAIRRAWNVVYRLYPDTVPEKNPFTKMDLKNTGHKTTHATREHLLEFVRAADELGLFSIGTAALITFEWLLREADIIAHFTWSDYRPDSRPDCVRLTHHKTKEVIWLPVEDENGLLFPELIQRIEQTPRRGPLVIMRDIADKKTGEFLPYREDWFRHRVAKVRDHAGLPKNITFTSFRHGGLTELGDAQLSDQSMMALSAHKTRAMLTVYSKRNEIQRSKAARKRLDYRSKL